MREYYLASGVFCPACGALVSYVMFVFLTDCGYKCEDLSSHYYIVDSGRCDIFHRCYENNVYTTFCPPGTFFNPGKCTCDHSKTIDWCREDGLNQYNKNSTWCDASTSTAETTGAPEDAR